MAKRGLSVTIDQDLRKRFYEYCQKNAINKSQLIEGFIKKYLEEKGK